MPLHSSMRPATLRARLMRLERDLHPYESWEERDGRARLAAWLAASDDHVECWLDYLEWLELAGTAEAVFSYSGGRAAVEAVAASLYAFANECVTGPALAGNPLRTRASGRYCLRG